MNSCNTCYRWFFEFIFFGGFLYRGTEKHWIPVTLVTENLYILWKWGISCVEEMCMVIFSSGPKTSSYPIYMNKKSGNFLKIFSSTETYFLSFKCFLKFYYLLFPINHLIAYRLYYLILLWFIHLFLDQEIQLKIY